MPPIRTLVLLFWILLAAPAWLPAADLRIMTWDIEDAFPAEKTAVLAQAVRKHKVDILALQNVSSTGARFHHSIQAELDKLFGANVYRHAVTQGSRFDGNAVFWNSKTVQVGDSSGDASIRMAAKSLRPAQIIHARSGAFDFRLVNVNLYEGSDDDDDTKLRQAAVLRTLLKKIAGPSGTNPLILAGNLQMGFPNEKVYDEMTDDFDVFENPAYQELNADGFLKFCTRDTIRKNPRAFSFIGDLLDCRRLVDHIAANDAAAKRYVKGSAQVVRIDREFFDSMDDYEWNFSDHLPVIARFKTK